MKYALFLFIFGWSLLLAQPEESQVSNRSEIIESALINYEYCLNHDNTGVVESAIGNVLRFKRFYPEADMSGIKTCLETICAENEIPKIRCKAFLASKILQDSTLVALIEKDFYQDTDQFFAILSIGAGIRLSDRDTMPDYFSREYPGK